MTYDMAELLENISDISLENILLCVVVLLVLTLLVYVYYSGLWSSIIVSTSETEYGPMTLAYKTLVGPYKDAGEFFTESFCLLPDREQLGIYYDDPEGLPANQLRCAVGPVLAKGVEKPDPEEMEKMVKNGFKIVHLPKPSYVVTATFPFSTTLSIFLAIHKVYPRLRDYIAERNLCAYPALELYTDSSIIFMMPLSKQEEFFVPEFQEEEMSVATTDLESFTSIESPDVRRDDAVFAVPRSPMEMKGNGEKFEQLRESEVSSLEESDEDEEELTHNRNTEETDSAVITAQEADVSRDN